jgi:bifunctional non-homologous end joining protein LigD
VPAVPPLDAYHRKRDFRRTPEPAGGTATDGGGRFAVQRHAARRMHYDFRLELDGTLKSWAVPKGPSLDPAEKRLAVHVEDHPLEYGDFEGTIPAGEYGAGEVILWDRGHWTPVGDPADGYRRGKLKFVLHGEKLRGGWTLARMGGRAGEGGKNWLLLKERDVEARPATEGDIVAERPESVATIARTALPARIRPQLATLADEPPPGDEWVHEIKYDGYRALCRLEDRRARVFTRSGQDWTDRFGPVAPACAALPVRTAWLDGEVVVLDDDGRSRFEALQEALSAKDGRGLKYVVFDLLHLDGVDLRPLPLEQRKQRLAQLLRRADGGETLRYGDHVIGRGAAFLRQVCMHGLEGIVSKRREAPHREGRHPEWRKVHCHERGEFVVGGFTDPGGSRAGLGALLLGAHEDGRLRYVGRVGTGFSDAKLRELRRRLDELAQPESPFAPFPDVPPGSHWTRPELVCEATFTNWTRDGRLRHPVFVALRDDKPAREVVRERRSRAGVAPRRADETIEIAGVRVSHPDRVLWPEVEVTKAELARYYVDVAEWILPHVAGRPLAVVRGPRGHAGATFFQKHLAPGMPAPVRSVRIADDDGHQNHLVIDDVAGLVALVQMDVLEIHVWGARADDVERPDRLVLDLDPDEELAWPVVVDGARAARLRFEHLGLESFVKTTGGKGLHVVVPLARRQGWTETKAFARALAADLARRLPDAFTINAARAARRGKIYLDYLRNGRGATAVAAYSSRARPGAPVAVPLAWRELGSRLRPAALTVRTVPERLARLRADPWERVPVVRQSITAAMRAALGV